MNIKEIVQLAKEKAPEQLSKMPDTRAVRLLREAFAIVLDEVENKEEGAVKIGGLGTFRIRLVDIEMDGQPATARRVIFKPHVPKR